jgi:hypothetical protein
MPYPLRYTFQQHFPVNAIAAYKWCTDFSPQDPKLMKLDNAQREVTKITESTIILKETFHTDEGDLSKEKLVHLYPEGKMWVSTHLSGPNKHSQFIYEITSEGNGSRLTFTALHLEPKDHMTEQEIEVLAKQLCHFDSDIWKKLASAMEKELIKP